MQIHIKFIYITRIIYVADPNKNYINCKFTHLMNWIHSILDSFHIGDAIIYHWIHFILMMRLFILFRENPQIILEMGML